MRKNYGLICYWDINNNCFLARSFDYPPCEAMGQTRIEAIVALDAEVQTWQETSREIGISKFFNDNPPTQSPDLSTPPVEQASISGTYEQNKRQSLLQKVQNAFAELQEYETDNFTPLEMEITYNPCVVHLRGDLDMNTVASVNGKVRELAQHQKRIIFDLRRIGFLDSAGLALLVMVRKKIAPDRGIVCIALPQTEGSQVERVLKLGRFDTLMPLCSSLEEAKELIALVVAGAA